ncbi:MAG: class I tRNA ligase family protein [Microthrixaceae bacterium]|nr:class I tRNA ligase family protein [Microthrixaceae bacterium]
MSDSGLSWDFFGRTSAPQNHDLTSHLARRLKEEGFTEIRTTSQVYSVTDGRFLPDRYVIGTCPNCAYERARGDQCENCGKQLDPTELLEARSALSGSTDLEVRDSAHVFLLQSKLADRIRAWVDSKDHWPQLTRSIAYKWLDEGLEDRGITRDLSWGIPVDPDDFPEAAGKVWYVWFDAPIGYISATREWADAGLGGDDPQVAFDRWWRTGSGAHDVTYTQFMGKDNVPFHTLSFPATLLGSGEDWLLVDRLKSFNWLTYYGGKFSTSQGRGVFMSDALELAPADCWRWYLMANAPESDDSSFTWELFGDAVNKDLVGTFGNFVNRVATQVDRHFDGVVPDGGLDGSPEEALWERVGDRLAEYLSAMDSLQFRRSAAALRALWAEETCTWRSANRGRRSRWTAGPPPRRCAPRCSSRCSIRSSRPRSCLRRRTRSGRPTPRQPERTWCWMPDCPMRCGARSCPATRSPLRGCCSRNYLPRIWPPGPIASQGRRWTVTTEQTRQQSGAAGSPDSAPMPGERAPVGPGAASSASAENGPAGLRQRFRGCDEAGRFAGVEDRAAGRGGHDLRDRSGVRPGVPVALRGLQSVLGHLARPGVLVRVGRGGRCTGRQRGPRPRLDSGRSGTCRLRGAGRGRLRYRDPHADSSLGQGGDCVGRRDQQRASDRPGDAGRQVERRRAVHRRCRRCTGGVRHVLSHRRGQRIEVTSRDIERDPPITDHVDRRFQSPTGVQDWSMMAVGDVIIAIQYLAPTPSPEGFLFDVERSVLERVAPAEFAPGGVDPGEVDDATADDQVPGDTGGASTTAPASSGEPSVEQPPGTGGTDTGAADETGGD